MGRAFVTGLQMGEGKSRVGKSSNKTFCVSWRLRLELGRGPEVKGLPEHCEKGHK